MKTQRHKLFVPRGRWLRIGMKSASEVVDVVKSLWIERVERSFRGQFGPHSVHQGSLVNSWVRKDNLSGCLSFSLQVVSSTRLSSVGHNQYSGSRFYYLLGFLFKTRCNKHRFPTRIFVRSSTKITLTHTFWITFFSVSNLVTTFPEIVALGILCFLNLFPEVLLKRSYEKCTQKTQMKHTN